MNLHTDRIEPKHTYLRGLDNDCYIACGIYLDTEMARG